MRVGAILLVLIGLASNTEAALLARAGSPRAVIVLATDPLPSERTAAKELAAYLEKITGARFEIRNDEGFRPRGVVLHVGPTRLARRLGLRPGRMGPEEWSVRAAGSNVVLAGGRPRGTLYAVYHFLEDDLGVRWWNAFEESVPKRPTLRIGEFHRSGRPAFEQRDMTSAEGTAEFLVRNRLNGARTGISWDYGGFEGFATPWFVHSFYYLIPPNELFASHPEYFSEREGKRTSEEAQLCLTNPDLPAIVADKLSGYAAAAEAKAAAGRPSPRMLDVSQNDWGGSCKCPMCAASAERYGSVAGTFLQFVNDVAGRVGREHPDALLTTLAYQYTFPPPSALKASDNVIVRLAGFGKRDFAKSVLAPENAPFRQAVEAWRGVAKRLWIWDYAVAFFEDERTLPIPSYRNYAADLRYYRDQGVSGIFVQHEFPIAADFRDMKLWMYVKLMEVPDRDPRALLLDFTNGYYGRSAPDIRRYLDVLEAAIDAKPGYIGTESDQSAYRHVDAEFVVRAERIFDQAEAAVRDDPIGLRRVRHARLSLDYAFLRVIEDADARDAATRLGLTANDRREVAERYRHTWYEQIEFRAEPATRDALREGVDKEVGAYLDAPSER